MQDLLGRIAALDPDASLGIRVIACFDELIVGRVGTRALLAAAASLAGCVAGCSWPGAATLRVDPSGTEVTASSGISRTTLSLGDEAEVWLERRGEPSPHDAIILERLGMAVRMRRGADGTDEVRRPLGILLDAEQSAAARREAAQRLLLHEGAEYRVLVAPLFAVWSTHPKGPGDVVATAHGSVHAIVVPADLEVPTVSLLGIGTRAAIADLPRSFRAGLTAARLANPERDPVVSADRFGGLVHLLADAESAQDPDAARLDDLMVHPWMTRTLDALTDSTTLRQAARSADVHHSTMQARIETLQAALGYDPLESFGRTRLVLAYLVWRLRHSHAFDLPAPSRSGTPAS